MEHKPALYALIRLHAELGGRIKDNQKEGEKLRADMVHVEAVLHILEPGFNARRIAARRKRRENPWFKRGTIFRAVLDTLRASPEPMTTHDPAMTLLAAKSIQSPPKSSGDAWKGR